MMRITALFLSAALGFAGASSGQAIQLRTGEVLVGEVVDATSEGLSFRRLDTGGYLELGWEDLSTLHAIRIKRLKGLVIEEDEEPTIEADVVIYSPGGGVREEVVGLIDWDATTSSHLMVKRKRDVLKLRRSADTIKNIRKRDVPVLEVYTADEWYELKKAEFDPGDDADKHIALGEAMRRVADYDRSLFHLEEADRLGGGKQSAQLPMLLLRVRNLKESAAERELLSRIRIMRNREQFDKAEELMAQFAETYADSPLLSELTREKARLDSALADYAVDRLRQLWDSTVRRIAEEHVSERDSTLARARAYAEEGMADDVFARVAKVLEMEAEVVAGYWASRGEHGRGRAAIFSYGIGSWVLGDDKVVAGTKAEGGQSAAAGGGGATGEDRELERILRKLREYRDQRRSASGSQAQEETEDGWWRDASRSDRTGWLRAYFAEFGGQMELTAAYAQACANCVGTGFTTELGDTGRERKVKCPLCHGTKYTRVIRAR